MIARLHATGLLDRLAIGLSALCAAHCVATVVLLTLLASAGGLLLDPAVHEIGLGLAIGLGVLALVSGGLSHGLVLPGAIGGLGLGVMTGALFVPHGPAETVFTMLGVAILAFGHALNRRASA